LIETDQLMAFQHEGFWRPMDTLKDKQVLEDLVGKGTMPWRFEGARLDEASSACGTGGAPFRALHWCSFGRYRNRRRHNDLGLDRSWRWVNC
jgi:hypothetical protein